MNIVEKLLKRPAEVQPVAGGFTLEAKAGLKEIGHKFIWAIQAKSLYQLIDDGVISGECVIPASNLKAFVPVAREVAVNPNRLLLPGTCNLSLDDMLEETEKYARRLRKINLKHGSLDTVDFKLTNAVVYFQLDRAYHQKNRQPLYIPLFDREALVIRAIDEINQPGYTAFVGRKRDTSLLFVLGEGKLSQLCIGGFTKQSSRMSLYGCIHPGSEEMWAAPVAQPKQIDTQVPPIFYT